MKLISLHLKDFQSHVDTTISFVDGLNVIVGPTDAGKSSIIRALLKVIRDVPAGKGYLRTGAEEYVLTLVFEKNSDQYILTRIVSASKNEYSIQKVGEAVQSFANFGREIPQEVLEALSMSLVQLENSETIDLHFSEQYDSPFLLSGTGSTRARLLGRIAGLHILGKATLAVSKDTRQISTEITHIETECDQLNKEISGMPDVNALETLLDTLQQALTGLKATSIRIDTLKSLLDALTTISIAGKKTLQEYKALPQISADFTSLHKTTDRVNYLEQLYTALQSVDSKINSLPVLPEVNVDFTECTHMSAKINLLQSLLTQLTALDVEIFGIDLQQSAEKVLAAEQEWQNELKLLGICPTCKQSTTKVGLYGEKTS